MKWRYLVLICLNSFTSGYLFAQPTKLLPQPGKIFISKTMENMEILDDSTLISSIQNNEKKSGFKVKNDTLVIKEAYNWYGKHNSTGYTVIYHDYKIIKSTNDTLILKNDYHGQFGTPHAWENPLLFVNIDRIKQPVNNFKYLKVNDSSPFKGSFEVTIDSTGTITYFKNLSTIEDFAMKAATSKKTVKFTGTLSIKEFENFKNVLSKSLINSLPELRGCGIDQGERWFTVMMDNKTYASKGCRMYYPQQLLFNYLYLLDNNIGVENKRKSE